MAEQSTTVHVAISDTVTLNKGDELEIINNSASARTLTTNSEDNVLSIVKVK